MIQKDDDSITILVRKYEIESHGNFGYISRLLWRKSLAQSSWQI